MVNLKIKNFLIELLFLLDKLSLCIIYIYELRLTNQRLICQLNDVERPGIFEVISMGGHLKLKDDEIWHSIGK